MFRDLLFAAIFTYHCRQFVKNLYLTPSKNPIRKLKEALLTWRLERSLSRRRIIEIYLNVAEQGEGIFGIEAAALAVVLPSPLHYHPVEGGRYVESRTEAVYRIMVRGAIVIPEYEQMLNEPAGNGSPPMQFTGDADLTREPCADYGDLPGC
ncbi:MAG: transglycosylase domain-containing protein [Pseudomonadota bacterium]